jgi:hypothetical protein
MVVGLIKVRRRMAGVDIFLGRFGHDGIAVVIEPID